MKSNPTFSIIVPVYNADKYLLECINYIKEQTFADFECILIDDGSSDDSPYLCNEICKADNRFRTIHTKNNGVSHARNIGLENALGKYITFADCDDTMIPIALESYYKVFSTDDRIDAIRGGYNILINKNIQNTIHTNSDSEYEDYNDLFNVLEKSRYYSFVWNMCIRKNIIDNIRFDEQLNWLEDHIFSYQCYLNCRKVYLLSEVIYNYNIRTNKNSLSKKQSPKVVYRAMELEYLFKNKLNNHKYLEQDKEIAQNYRRNIHRMVCLIYYGNYPYSYRKELSNKTLQINDGLFREDNLFFNNNLPFFIRDLLIRLLLKIKGSFAPYE